MHCLISRAVFRRIFHSIMVHLTASILRLHLLLLPALSFAAGKGDLSFNRDIRPILADACFHCHGPDPGTRKAGLRLDTEGGFFDPKSGPTVVRGDAAKSPLYQRLISQDPDEVMPPPESHKTLKSAEIALIKQWIEQGAPWQPHWSLIPPQRPAVPAVKDRNWVANPVDAFVLAKLEAAGLQPAPPADAHTLIRRLSLDITGLPPGPDLIQRFATAPRLDPAAQRQLVDELLKSPAYGEHRARY